MHCWKKLFSLVLLTCCCGFGPGLAGAAGIEVRHASLQANDEGYELAADLAIEFPPALEAAVARGLTLYFIAEFELNRPRWYWLDERTVRQTRTWRLSYHALTRQYRLGSGALLQSFTSLEAALRVLTRLRSWQVIERKEIKIGETYQASLRLTHDLSQLPKPFQINALGNRDWDLSSPWQTFPFVPAATDGPVQDAK